MLKSVLLFFLLLTGIVASAAGTTDTLLLQGTGLYKKGDYPAAITVLERSTAQAQAAKDTPTLIAAYRTVGNIYSQTGKQVEALRYYQLSVALSEASGNTSAAANTVQNIGALYEEMGDYKKALASYSAAENIALTRRDSATLADCANNKGIIYEQYLHQYSDAGAEYNKALAIYQQMGNSEGIATCYINLGVVQKASGDYAGAISSYTQSLTLAEQNGFRFLVAANLTNIGNVYGAMKQYAKAIEYNKRGLEAATAIHALGIMVETAKNIAENYEAMKDYRQAYGWQQQYILYNDSLVNTERDRQVAELETKYQNEKKEREITGLKQQQEISQLRLSEQELLIQKKQGQFLLSVLAIVLVVLVAVVVIRYQRFKQKQAYEKAIREAEEQERKRISREMHDDIGAGLTQITLMSEAAKHSGNVKNELVDIAGTSRKLVANLGEIIWSLDPDSKSVEQLYAYMREQLHPMLEYSGMEYSFQFPQQPEAVILSSRQKRSLLLVSKEAVNNAVKYSGATRLSIRSLCYQGKLSFFIEDNGKGFDTSVSGKGNGLRNMRARMAELGGSFNVSSSVEGTQVHYSIPV